MVTKKQRQRALARQKWERQRSRRAVHRARVRRRSVVAGAVVGVLAVAAAVYGISLLFKDDSKAHAAPMQSQGACTSAAPAWAEYLECGDLTGSGGSRPGYNIGNENDRPTLGSGRLVMADGADRSGSRSSITTGDTPTFDHSVTVFARSAQGSTS